MATASLVHAVLDTHTGLVRDHNEDYTSAWEPQSDVDRLRHGWLYIVADGVGGAAAGEVASRYATERIQYHYLASAHLPNLEERLRQAIQAANEDLRRLAVESQPHNHMATTVVAAVVRDNQAVLANVGDSRGYHWRAGRLQQITKDQSLVAQLVEEGAITQAEALHHPRRNIILFSIGSMREPRIDLFQLPLEPDDRLLLCSDGLTRHVEDEEIAAIVGRPGLASAVHELIDLANERGGSDNITIALIHIQRPPVPAGRLVIPTPRLTVRSRTAAALWGYTLFLAVLEMILILLIWYGLRI